MCREEGRLALRRVLDSAPMDPAVALALARRWRSEGDLPSRNRLVAGHLRIPAVYALRYRRYGEAGADLFSEGTLGLLRAADNFDPDRSVRFATYADYWVRSRVVRYTLRTWSIVGGSTALQCKTFFRLRRELAKARACHPSSTRALAAAAATLGIPEERLRAWVSRVETRDVSVDAPVGREGTATLRDLLVSVRPGTDELCGDKEQAEIVWGVLAGLGLDPRQRAIVEGRLMASRGDRMTLREIGERFGISRQRVLQVERELRGVLREALASHVCRE
jgi:RNA polymerase sigma-32 factor